MRKLYLASLALLVISLAFTACGQKNADVTKPSAITSVIEKTEVVHDTSVVVENVTNKDGKAETVTNIVDVTEIKAVTEIVTEVNSEQKESKKNPSSKATTRLSDEAVYFTDRAGNTVTAPSKKDIFALTANDGEKASERGTSFLPPHSFPETPSMTVNQSGSSCPHLLSLSEPASRGGGLSVVIMGKANTEYTLESDFNGSGEGTESANAAGIAGWSLVIPKSCSVGSHRLTVRDGSGSTLTIDFYVS